MPINIWKKKLGNIKCTSSSIDFNCMKDESIQSPPLPESLDEQPYTVKGKCECEEKPQRPQPGPPPRPGGESQQPHNDGDGDSGAEEKKI